MALPSLLVILADLLDSTPEIYRNQRAIVLSICIIASLAVHLIFPKIGRLQFKYGAAAVTLVALFLFTKPNIPLRGPGGAMDSDKYQQLQGIVAHYMQSHATAPNSLHILEWSDLSTSGPDTQITVRYDAALSSSSQTTATVSFTVRSGAVVNAQVIAKSS